MFDVYRFGCGGAERAARKGLKCAFTWEVLVVQGNQGLHL